MPLEELSRRGQATFDKMYGKTGKDVQTLLDTIYPDLGVCLVLSESLFQMILNAFPSTT